MDDSIRPYIAAARTVWSVWTTLEQIFGSRNRTCVVGLKEQLHHATQEDRSVSDFLHHVRQIATEISHIDSPISKEDLTLFILHGLREEFRDIEPSIMLREKPYEIDELHAALIGYEETLRRRNRIPVIASANAVFCGQQLSTPNTFGSNQNQTSQNRVGSNQQWSYGQTNGIGYPQQSN